MGSGRVLEHAPGMTVLRQPRPAAPFRSAFISSNREVTSRRIAATPISSPASSRIVAMVNSSETRPPSFAQPGDDQHIAFAIPALARLHHVAVAFPVPGAEQRRDDEIERLPDRLRGSVAEDALGALVPMADDAVPICRDDRIGARRLRVVGVHVRGEHSVVAKRADRIRKQSVDVIRVRLARLIRHLSGGLIDIDTGTVRLGEAHGHTGTGEHAGAILDPARWPVVVAGVESDAVVELNLRLCIEVTPCNTVSAIGLRGRLADELGLPGSELVDIEVIQRRGRPVGTVGGDVEGDFKTLADERSRLRIGHRSSRVDI